MVQLIKAPTTKVITKDGEVQMTIAIELTLNINAQGLPQVTQIAQTQPTITLEEPKADWTIPSFKSGGKIKFGKNTEE